MEKQTLVARYNDKEIILKSERDDDSEKFGDYYISDEMEDYIKEQFGVTSENCDIEMVEL
jgi:accessory colonization factor AcfC